MAINWNAIPSLASQIKQCDNLGLITPSIAMSYICIDAMASLSRPENKDRVTRKDFIEWVDKYLKGHPDQLYKYRGRDVYAARCAFLHTYGSRAELHEQDDLLEFVYHDGGRHAFEHSGDSKLVVIGIKSFTNDVISAVSDFMDDCANNVDLKNRVEKRLSSVLGIVPLD